ncbi:hypothetical protein [Zavarzinella formosa]|uniref:hypothetical protein n=1 Tax=Zavarzinella formosa TaxID=360055 RepID=UPI000594BACA|nr:hypothetical protein [Zavarzinella formosa]
MRCATRGRQICLGLLLAGGAFMLGTAPDMAAQPGKEKEKEKFGKKEAKGGPAGKADHEARKAFDGITELAQQPPAGKSMGRLLDHAKAFYRAGLKTREEDPRRGGEWLLAANDAVRGLEHARRASFKPVDGLPEPPTEFDGPKGKDLKDGPKEKDFGPKGKDFKDGPKEKDGPKGKDFRDGPEARRPWSEAGEALQHARDLIEAGSDVVSKSGPARDFLEGAKVAYNQARAAYEGGEYRKAGELARAAAAWSHVGEHLLRAEEDGPAALPERGPEPRKATGAPPPPPAVKE